MRLVLPILALAALLLPGAARAQDLPEPGDGFAWERVGDTFIQARTLTFTRDHTLWAGTPDGVAWLDLSAGSPGVWIFPNPYSPAGDDVLVLGGDTLVATSPGATYRSLDGGVTWPLVYDDGGDALYEVPEGTPYAGRILTSHWDIAYSTDRAATFTDALVPGEGGGSNATAADFVAFPAGSEYAGRILAAGRWGVTISDDGGATFRESGLYEGLTYTGEEVAVMAGPGGAERAVMVGRNVGVRRVWVSDDGGETWADRGALPEGPPDGIGGTAAGLFAVGGTSAVVVMGRGTVYRTDDGGETWAAVGRAPDIDDGTYASSAAVGADGRLYVGLTEGGANGEGWVYRTGEVVTVAAEPGAPAPVEVGLNVYPNPASVSLTVEVTGLSSHAERPGEVTLYDALGRAVRRVPLVAGRAALDVRGLPPGAYAVRAMVEAASGRKSLSLTGRVALVR